MSSRSAVNPSPEYRQAGASMTRTRTLVTLAMLSAIAFVVMLASKLMPSVMGFLDFDFKDVVICIGAFVFGPLAGAGMVVTVAFLELFTVSTTGIIGFIMNVLATGGFCCTAAVIYKRRHTMMGAIAGLLAGVHHVAQGPLRPAADGVGAGGELKVAALQPLEDLPPGGGRLLPGEKVGHFGKVGGPVGQVRGV